MQTQYQIQVTKIDNGFLIVAQGDEPGSKQKRLAAPDEDAAKKLIHDLTDNEVFVTAEKPVEGKILTSPMIQGAPNA